MRLIISDPLGNSLDFYLTGHRDGLRVLGVWEAEVEVVGRVSDVEGFDAVVDFVHDAACVPGV